MKKKPSRKAADWVHGDAMGKWLAGLVGDILRTAAVHSKDQDDFQALAMTALTSIVFGVVGELADGDPPSMKSMIDDHATVLRETALRWKMETDFRAGSQSDGTDRH